MLLTCSSCLAGWSHISPGSPLKYRSSVHTPPKKSSGISTDKKIHFTVDLKVCRVVQRARGERGMQSADRVHRTWRMAPPLGVPGALSPRAAPASLGTLGAWPVPLPPSALGSWLSREQKGQPSGQAGVRPSGPSQSCQSGPSTPSPGAGWAEAAGAAQPEAAARGRRAWEPTPANPALSSSAILSLLIKQPRNMEFTDVFSSSSS